MCGIIGYQSQNKEAFDKLDEGLKRLEYRGYDSFGFATISEGNLLVEKKIGKVSTSSIKPLPGKIGIGHTRWATHGKVTEKNTHPHKDCAGRLAVVHNGIIENFQELKKDLILKEHIFLGETDTEIIAHSIEEFLKIGYNLKQAVIGTGNLLKGRNAFVVLDSTTNKMIAFRNGSPLIIGIKESEIFLASDIQAFLHETNEVMYIDDNEIVVINGGIEFFNLKNGEKIEKRRIKIDLDSNVFEKGDYKDYMLKEIMEQKETLAKAINQDAQKILHVAQEINNAKNVFFIGCGTAARVAHTAEYVFSMVADRQVNFIPASEFENYKHFLLPETLVIAISQSGETADVLEALNVAKEKKSRIISITNSPESTIAKMADFPFLINAGPERAVASTKATTAQIALVILLAYACTGELIEGDKVLLDVAGKVNDMLNPRYKEHIKALAEKIFKKENAFIIGRGINYPMALESAIKIMEVSYINSQGFAGGELKHGPIALIEENTPVIALVSEGKTKEEIISNAIEVKSRGAYIVGVSPENNEVFDYWIKVPEVDEVASSLVNLIPMQLLSYYLGKFRGHDVDCPRSLAKSVTVK
ncbi:glutamine--fructose-6-phosphate transaminase (isomerizing) [archaeon]|jgi:glutamine---fructose-6-phosphate transaminase (isomerizing)|nr:glutamine--fructose-6-phosphate transaminase (isomerizing) [archaeon]